MTSSSVTAEPCLPTSVRRRFCLSESIHLTGPAPRFGQLGAASLGTLARSHSCSRRRRPGHRFGDEAQLRVAAVLAVRSKQTVGRAIGDRFRFVAKRAARRGLLLWAHPAVSKPKASESPRYRWTTGAPAVKRPFPAANPSAASLPPLDLRDSWVTVRSRWRGS